MLKCLTVREFERIAEEPYPDCKVLEPKAFAELVDFIETSAAGQVTGDDFFSVYKAHGIRFVKALNYVGVIQLKSGYQIEILPKLDLGNDSDEETRKIFTKMLCCMHDFPGKVFTNADLKTQKMNIYEVFIAMYVQELQEVVKRGLKSSYLRQEDNLSVYKGKLLINQQIKYNFAHAERFYVAFDEFHVNRPANRIIKATLLKLCSISHNYDSIRSIRQLLGVMDEVEASTNYVKDFASIVMDRSMKDYENLLAWSKVFLLNESFTNFAGATKARALLFPMEKVYEAYVGKYIKQVFGTKGWRVNLQDKSYHLFIHERGEEKLGEIFTLRPDIVCRKDNNIIVMDTKWKRITANLKNNYNISQADMYQMFAYGKKYNTREVWLLYPAPEDKSMLEKNIKFTSDDVNSKVVVRVKFIDFREDKQKQWAVKLLQEVHTLTSEN